MAYAALVSLTNTIDRFLNSNLYSISVEEKQQITSLLDYVTPFQDFLDKFPDKFKSLEGRMREVANEAEDILEYLVLEKVFLSSDEESELHDELDRGTVIKDINLKMENMWKTNVADNSLKVRIRNVVNEAKKINCFLEWETNHIRFRDKRRFLPAEFAMFKSRFHFINHLKKMGSEIDSIMAEATAVKNNNSDKAASSSGLAPPDRVSDDEKQEEEETECYRSSKHELQMERVMEEIALIAAQVKEIKDSSSSKDVERGGADTSAAPTSSSTDPSIHKDSMVGFEDYVLDVKDRLCGEPSRLQVIPICGMGGIGKTTLARNVYDDPLTVGHFVIRVWVTISQDYSAQRILSSLLESLKEYNTGRLGQSDDEKVHKILMGRRYLVVMDDMWSGEAWDVVRRVFPDDGNGSRVVRWLLIRILRTGFMR
ncbi:disease resistance protein RGA2-like isoform X2 [Salvia miltiorrhiza]|uniref:disease resistance protein RGA2-like isoform X2 n=1 Tax=Salvia miltiorrhiza TaxID=226208 RepID=UPI0025AB73D0|nr:disease resistance protein RGA2-like isoform X2 [Salvia miltiorrhiza]